MDRATRQSERILVMDDEAMIRDVLGRMLTMLGYEVVVTETGEEVIESYREAIEAGCPFDAVILDLTVPGAMGGLEALQQLKVINPAIKAIVSSGYCDGPVMTDHRGHGFSGIVVKPYAAEQLREVVRAVLELKDATGNGNDAG